MPTPPLTALATAVLGAGSPERILQVECGEGDGALFLAREFPRAKVRGADAAERAVRLATARVGLDPEGRIAFKQGGAADLPFPDSHFDLVVAVDSSPSPAETARVLRPEGLLIVACSRDRGACGGLPARLLRWRLARRGLRVERAEAAGDGSFSVARLR